MPLSGKTRYELEKRHDDSPLHGDDRLAAFAPDLAEWLLLAQLFQLPLDQNVPAPTIAEWGDPLWEGVVDENLDRARKIQEEIIRRLVAGESFSDLMLLGWVYQFWLENQRCPTVTEIAERMGLSRQAFYRRHSRAELYRAYLIASGRVGTYLPDPEGLDEVELANRKAKKPRGPNLNRDA